MKTFVLCATLLVLGAGVGTAGERAGTVTVEVDLSGQGKTGSTRLWIPYAVSDEAQEITQVVVSGDYEASAVYRDGATGAHILYAQWPAGAAHRHLQYRFDVTRQGVERRDFPASEPPWNPGDYAVYLRPNRLGPVDGPVKALAESITGGQRTVLGKAKAIYDWVCENTYRDPSTLGCGTGDVCALLQKPGGKCTDISSLFITLCRAVGVPAREIFSVRLGRKPSEDITTWQHCWAEFFVPGYGWVPADPADVRKAMLVEKLDLKDPRTRTYRDFFWGGLDPFRVVISQGRDLVLNPPQQGAPLNTFGYPYAEIGGKALDSYRPEAFSYRITYQEKRP